MKKLVCVLLILSMIFSMVGCNSQNNQSTTTKGEVKSDSEAESKPEKEAGKIAIVTTTVSQNEEEYRSAESMVKKYGDRIIHETWPDNFMTEQEQMITTLTKISSNPEIKALVINQAVPGTNAAVDKLREIRDDMLVIYCNYGENAPDVAKRADFGILGDNLSMGYKIPEQAKKLGAEVLVHYSFPRHMSLAIFSVRRDRMKEKCKELGMIFVDATAPDPTGDAGVPGAQQFILEDVPKMVEKYGKNIAFQATNCAMQIPLIEKCIELGCIYPVPCCASPFHAYPTALGIELSDEQKGDVNYVIEATREKLREKNALGRFSNLPVPGPILQTITATEYSLKWLAGETNGKYDEEVLKEIIKETAGVDVEFSKLEDSGVTYDNLLMYLTDFITY